MGNTASRVGNADNALPSTTTVNLGTGPNYAGYLDLNGHNQTLAGLVQTSGCTLTQHINVYNSSSTPSTLTLNVASGTNTYVA